MPAESVVRFLLLMPWGRVGSNLVMSVIWQCASREFGPSRIALDNEAFNQIREDRKQLSWVRSFYEQPRYRLIGSKQSMNAIANPQEILRYCEDSEITIVAMRRENLLKTAISQIRAEEFADRTRKTEGVGRWALKNGELPLPAMVIDPSLLLLRLEVMRKADERLSEHIGEFDHLDIKYEALLSDMKGTLKDILERIDLAWKDPKIPFAKATPDILSDAVSNLDEIRDTLPTKFKQMCD